MRYLLTLFLTLTLFGCDAKTEAPNEVASANTTSQQSSTKQDIRSEEITYEVDGTTLTGYLTYDANQTGQRPGILVVHEWWGLNDYVRTRAHMLAKLGYTAFALDMYGDGKLATHPDDAQKFMTEVMNNMDVAKARFLAAQKILTEHDTTLPDKTAAIGYCFGGGVVLQMARDGDKLRGVASFHGMLSTQAPAKPHAVKAKVLVLHGADDPFVPAEQVDAFKKEMAAAVVDYKFIAYPGAVHAFTNPGATRVGEEFNLPLAYNEAADEESWNELKSFLVDVFE